MTSIEIAEVCLYAECRCILMTYERIVSFLGKMSRILPENMHVRHHGKELYTR